MSVTLSTLQNVLVVLTEWNFQTYYLDRDKFCQDGNKWRLSGYLVHLTNFHAANKVRLVY